MAMTVVAASVAEISRLFFPPLAFVL